MDPIGFRGGQSNLYGYVGNRPMVGVDPSGLTVFFLRGGFLADSVWIDRWRSRLSGDLPEEETIEVPLSAWDGWANDTQAGQRVADFIERRRDNGCEERISLVGQSRGGSVAALALQNLVQRGITPHTAIFLDPVPTLPGVLPLKRPVDKAIRYRGTEMQIPFGTTNRPVNFWQFSEDQVIGFEPRGNILGSRALGNVTNVFFDSPTVHWSDRVDGVVWQTEIHFWGSHVLNALR